MCFSFEYGRGKDGHNLIFRLEYTINSLVKYHIIRYPWENKTCKSFLIHSYQYLMESVLNASFV